MANHQSLEFSQLNLTQLCWMVWRLLQRNNENVKYTDVYFISHSLLVYRSSLTCVCNGAVFGPSRMCDSFAIRISCVGFLLFFWECFSWKEEIKLDKSSSSSDWKYLSNHNTQCWTKECFCHDQEKCSEININEQICNYLKLLKMFVFLLGWRTIVTCLVPRRLQLRMRIII